MFYFRQSENVVSQLVQLVNKDKNYLYSKILQESNLFQTNSRKATFTVHFSKEISTCQRTL